MNFASPLGELTGDIALDTEVEHRYRELYAGPGAVRETLHKYVVAR